MAALDRFYCIKLSTVKLASVNVVLLDICLLLNCQYSGLYPAIFGKKMHLTSKLRKINDIEHNNGSKIHPQNRLFLIVLCQVSFF